MRACGVVYNRQMSDSPASAAVSSALDKAGRLARAPQNPEKVAAPKAMSGVLEAARRKPVAVTQNGKTAAVVLSANRYREWVRFLNAAAAAAEEMEDEILLAMAKEAEKEGMASREESEALLRRLSETCGD